MVQTLSRRIKSNHLCFLYEQFDKNLDQFCKHIDFLPKIGVILDFLRSSCQKSESFLQNSRVLAKILVQFCNLFVFLPKIGIIFAKLSCSCQYSYLISQDYLRFVKNSLNIVKKIISWHKSKKILARLEDLV